MSKNNYVKSKKYGFFYGYIKFPTKLKGVIYDSIHDYKL
jgi:hypothetical protein